MFICEKCKREIGNNTAEKIIFVEGKDDRNFLKEYLKYLDIENVEISDVGGEGNFKIEIPRKLIESNRHFSKIGIISDADDNSPQKKFEELLKILNEINLLDEIKTNDIKLEFPKSLGEFSNNELSIGIFIMPNNNDKGAIEDLILKTIEGDKVMDCVKEFINCVDKKYTTNKETADFNKKQSKRKIQIYLATKTELANSIDTGAQKGHFNFESEKLDKLKNFLLAFK